MLVLDIHEKITLIFFYLFKKINLKIINAKYFNVIICINLIKIFVELLDWDSSSEIFYLQIKSGLDKANLIIQQQAFAN